MPRRMSCSLSVDAVRDRTKTVTRRVAWTWHSLKPGDKLTLVEKGMGLKAGQRQVVLATVVVVANDVVKLREITANDVVREGFPEMSPDEFVAFWLRSHNLYFGSIMDAAPGKRPYPVSRDVVCRRIEFRYLDDQGGQ